MAANSYTPRLRVRSSNGVYGLKLDSGLVADPSAPKDAANAARVMCYSKDGSLYAYHDGTVIKVLSTADGSTLCEIARPRTLALVFSPNNSQLAAWENYSIKKGGAGPAEGGGAAAHGANDNLTVWSTGSGEMVTSYINRGYENWGPQWTDDDAWCVRLGRDEVHFYDATDYSKGVCKRLKLKGIAKFSLAPGEGPCRLITFVPVDKGAPAKCGLYREPNLERPLAFKSFFKADKINFKWNAEGSACLIATATDLDTTGKSYYGETNLYYMGMREGAAQVILDKTGPISDFDWAPTGDKFCVVYGSMPAKAALFNSKCDKVFDFGTGPRNWVRFSPHGNIIMLAGFGNISAGVMQFWDPKEKKLINQIERRDSTMIAWCPDSRHFLTATTSPRLKVDNGFTVWHYANSAPLCQQEDMKELWDVAWQPAAAGAIPVHPIEQPKGAGGKAKAFVPVKAQAYRPPGARGTQSSIKLHVEEAAENVKEPEEQQLSKSALKNKKRKEAKARALRDAAIAASGGVVPKKKSAEQQAAVAAAASIVGTPKVKMTAPDAAQSDEKRIRNLNKKLRQIDSLKAKQAAGEFLQTNQLEKIKEEETLKAEVAELAAQLEALRA